MERPGWFDGVRSRAVPKCDQLFERFPRAAPLVAPAPLSGIHRVPPAPFAVASIVTGLTWISSPSDKALRCRGRPQGGTDRATGIWQPSGEA
jgi:hypothetical protein